MRNFKKKVALLLAVVMMLSLLPMNVFGGASRVIGVATGTGQSVTIQLDAEDFEGLVVTNNALAVRISITDPVTGSAENNRNISAATIAAPGAPWSNFLVATTAGMTVVPTPAGIGSIVIPILLPPGAAGTLVSPGANGTQDINLTLRLGTAVHEARVTVEILQHGTTVATPINNEVIAVVPRTGAEISIGPARTFNTSFLLPEVSVTEQSSVPGSVLRNLGAGGVGGTTATTSNALQLTLNPGFSFVPVANLGTPSAGISVYFVDSGDYADRRAIVLFGTAPDVPSRETLTIDDDLLRVVWTGSGTPRDATLGVIYGRAVSIGAVGAGFARFGDAVPNAPATTVGTFVDADEAGLVVEVDVEELATVESGVIASGGTFATNWTSPISVTELGRGSWDISMEQLSQLDFTMPPGVRIEAVAWRARLGATGTTWTNNAWAFGATDTGAGFGPGGTTQITAVHSVEDLDRATITPGIAHNRLSFSMSLPRALTGGNAREIEVRFRLSIEPGFEGDVDVTVGGTAMSGSTETVTVATAFTQVSVPDPGVTANIYEGFEISGALTAIELPDFTILEVYEGRLRSGDFIYFSMNHGRTGTFGIELSAPRVEVVGDSGLVLGAVSATGATDANVFRVPVTSPSDNGPATIRVHGMEAAGIFRPAQLEDGQYDINVNVRREGGNRYSNNRIVQDVAIPGDLVNNVRTRTFSINEHTVRLLAFGEGAITPPPGVGPGVDPGPGVGNGFVEPEFVAAASADRISSVGFPLVDVVDDVTLVNLRGLYELFADDGATLSVTIDPDSGRNRSVFTFPRAGGGSSVISIYRGEALIQVGGVPQPVGPFGLVRPGGTWYMRFDTLTLLMNLTADLEGGVLSFYA